MTTFKLKDRVIVTRGPYEGRTARIIEPMGVKYTWIALGRREATIMPFSALRHINL